MHVLDFWKQFSHLAKTAALACLLAASCGLSATAQDPSPLDAELPGAAEETPAVPEEAEPLVPEPDKADSLESMVAKYPEVAEAVEKFKAREFDEALTLAQAAAEKHDALPPGEVLVASLHFAARDVNGAIRMLDKAAEAHPNDPSAYLDLGNIAILQNRLTDATLHFERTREILDAFEGNTERKEKAEDRLEKGLATLAEKKEQWAKAESLLAVVAEKSSDDAAVQIRLARAMFRNKKYKPAYEHMKQSEAVAESNASPELAMAQFYAEMEDNDSAKKWIDYAVQQSPEDVKTRLAAVQWNWQRGNAKDVEKHAKKAVELDPANLAARMLYGMYAHYAGDIQTAAKQFEAVLSRDPTNFAARNNLAMVLADSDQAEAMVQAKRLAEENLQAASNNAVAGGTLAFAHFKLGQYDDAARLMQAISQAGGLNNRNNVYFMARIADRAGQREQGVKVLKQILEQPQLFEMRGNAEQWLKSVEAED